MNITEACHSASYICARYTGCSLNIVFFQKNSLWPLSRFFLGVSTGLHAWTTNWQVEHSRTGRVKKNHNIIRKKTIINEHLVHNISGQKYSPSLMPNSFIKILRQHVSGQDERV